jgi:quinolinate synthase
MNIRLSRRWLDRSRLPGHLHGMDQPQNLKGVDIRAEIDRLRKERNAVILAHYYQKPEIQDLADFVGDSLDLSRKAQATDADVIAFCGVRFMAETAKILSPQKTVILPDMDAGCSLEDSCPPEQFAAFRAQHPDAIALTYINCSAAVKALSDVIVTSSSAEKILSQIPKDQKIIFGPDRNLGGYLARKTGRDLILWPGVCIVHEAFSETELLKLKAQHPDAPGMSAGDPRSRRLRGFDERHPCLCRRVLRRHADRRDRAAHHPPDGKGAAGQDLHRCAGR